jgi:hypothetical protein
VVGQHVHHLAALGNYFQDLAMIDDTHTRIAAIRRGSPPNSRNYFLVTSCNMSTWGRPSSSEPIAPPKAFI